MNPLLTRSYENIGRARHTNQSSCCVFIVNLHFNTQRLHIFSPSVSTIWRCVHVCMFMCAIFCFISSPSIFLLRFTCTQQYWVRINHNHIPVQLIQKTHWWPFLMLLSALTFSTYMLYCDYSTLPTQTRQKLRDYLCWLFHPLKASLLTYARKRLGKKNESSGSHAWTSESARGA